MAKAIKAFHPDLKRGDAFLHNSPYRRPTLRSSSPAAPSAASRICRPSASIHGRLEVSRFPGEEGRHLCHVFSWLRLRENENFYAHPIEGLNAVIDLKTGEVIRVDDYGVVPVPQQQANYERQFIKTPRAALKPIDVVQPEGVNFRVEGSKLTWHKWSLVVGFNAREALTLHDISYDGRSVLQPGLASRNGRALPQP